MVCEILNEICVLRLKECYHIGEKVWFGGSIDFLDTVEQKPQQIGDLDSQAVGTGKTTFLVWESEIENHKDRKADAFLPKSCLGSF